LFVKYLGKNSDDEVEVIVLTGSDNLSLYVLALNYSDYIKNYNKNILDLLKTFQYNSYYKYPLASYSFSCENS
jgi:hypothetical protein